MKSPTVSRSGARIQIWRENELRQGMGMTYCWCFCLFASPIIIIVLICAGAIVCVYAMNNRAFVVRRNGKFARDSY